MPSFLNRDVVNNLFGSRNFAGGFTRFAPLISGVNKTAELNGPFERSDLDIREFVIRIGMQRFGDLSTEGFIIYRLWSIRVARLLATGNANSEQQRHKIER